MVPRKRKGESGEVSNYMTRKAAMYKLQLNLKDFRRLCILKGVFPREPRNRKKVQKGNSRIQTLYYEKDIRFLLHEPVVWKFREFKVFLKKLKKAQEKRNWETVERLRANKPKYSLDHIVKERYPTFIDAIRDLEDCLCLIFLYSTFPRTARTPVEMVDLCKRLSVEFMHFVIESRALRKVFCSIKGYYFQADIKGQTITWIVPHNFGYQNPATVDMKLMSVFVEFYTTMLGFINFRLYNSINLTYPPVLAGMAAESAQDDSCIAALNQSLKRTVLPDEIPELDNIPMSDDSEAVEAARKEAEAVENQSKLFVGLKFFLGREVPREPLVFMIRSMGGEVSWCATTAPGSSYTEEDDRVTHQISDRESISNKKLGRFYVQPQWIFDSINRRSKLNEKDYALGETLPPHLSPFMAERRIGDYMPPEEKALLEGDKGKEEEEDEEVGEEEEEEEEDDDNDQSEDDDGEEEAEAGTKVTPGKREKKDKEHERRMQEDEEYRLRVMMVQRKHQGLYKSMMKNRKKRVNESKNLEKKRKAWDEENKPAKKTKKA
ncbi:pescadillo-like [Eurytemora carolleeae]|uniref:pescadillo-like n=1 Tax=Eurytemora carolleeae TaxID=1294199 RepID=UPI000C781058|nr:pescadillo-like [Eurytemora carolleeae]|eukprot:XP_023338284.1 pescadillo-like [Eurytemora affinis]